MSVKNKGSDTYPLRTKKIMRDGKVYYDRDERKKSWFLLDLAIDPVRRVPFYPETQNS